jgi:TatD DNase family protein
VKKRKIAKFRYIDVHAHLEDEVFNNDRDKILRKAKDILILNAGMDHETNLKSLALAKHYKNIKPCLGFHPEVVVESRIDDVKKEVEFIRENSKKVVAISEIGLDYKYKDKEKQKKAFYMLLSLAQELNKPVIVHSRRAVNAVINLMSKFDVKAVLHAFSGTKEELRRALNCGYYITVMANVVNNPYRQWLAKEVPLERLLTETDSPVLGPKGNERNEPINIIPAVKLTSQLKDISEDEVRIQILKNAKKLFKLRIRIY